MQGSDRGMVERNAAPPLRPLTLQAITTLADALGHYPAEFAALSYRVAQAHGGCKSLQGRRRPLERKAREPLARAGAGGQVQALQQCRGPGPWQAAAVRRQPCSRGDETRGDADGVCIVDGSDLPRQGGGRWGQVANCPAGVCTASARRTG
jgi:hypothetical protein